MGWFRSGQGCVIAGGVVIRAGAMAVSRAFHALLLHPSPTYLLRQTRASTELEPQRKGWHVDPLGGSLNPTGGSLNPSMRTLTP